MALADSNGSTDIERQDGRFTAADFPWCGQRSRWIGWTGIADRTDHEARRRSDGGLESIGVTVVHLSHSEILGFYDRYSNRVLRSVLNGTGTTAASSDDWTTYRTVNDRYAETIARELRAGDLIWVHDYHLMLVPRLVRERCPWARVGFFLHAPFPSVDRFVELPHASALIDGVLGADTIEVRTSGDLRNFLAAVKATHLFRARDTVVNDNGRRVCVFASVTELRH